MQEHEPAKLLDSGHFTQMVFHQMLSQNIITIYRFIRAGERIIFGLESNYDHLPLYEKEGRHLANNQLSDAGFLIVGNNKFKVHEFSHGLAGKQLLTINTQKYNRSETIKILNTMAPSAVEF